MRAMEPRERRQLELELERWAWAQLAERRALVRRAATMVAQSGRLRLLLDAAAEAAWETAFREPRHDEPGQALDLRARARERQLEQRQPRNSEQERRPSPERASPPVSGCPLYERPPASRRNTRSRKPAQLPSQKPTPISTACSRPVLRAYYLNATALVYVSEPEPLK